MNQGRRPRPIPVILDTDIGGDIDDTWALAMLLKCPELDLRLLTTCAGDTPYRAKVAARLLEVAGRADVPVGIGIQQKDTAGPQAVWVDRYDLRQYPGRVIDDGVASLVEAIMASPEPVTLICIGPLTNIAAALEREPRIAERARFVGMHGNIRKPFGSATCAIPEYNVKVDVPAARKVFAAPWDMTITPLDTCGFVILRDQKYRAIADCTEPLTAAVMENYRLWCQHLKRDWAATRSSVLFDTVAVYLAFAESLAIMEDLPLRIEDDGLTAVCEKGRRVRCATEWQDLPAFEDLLVDRLLNDRITPAATRA
jgi:inosine-uridine nucleoside N-ribohydrolase